MSKDRDIQKSVRLPKKVSTPDAAKRRKRCILIGRSTAGKTTLCQKILNQDLCYHKTQTVQLVGEDSLIDTPGEYLERRRSWGNLAVVAADADLLLLVQDATEKGTMFPAAYAANFMKPAVGVVTKCDLADEAAIFRAGQYLRMAGARIIFETSSVSGDGVDALMKYLDEEK